MPYAVPTVAEMFSDAGTSAERAERFETYKGALAEARAESKNNALAPAGEGNTGQQIVKRSPSHAMAERVAQLEKGLSPDVLAGAQADLEAIKGALAADVAKDWTVNFPNTAGLVPYDLEAPAKLLVPRATPLRNMIPRIKGQGTARIVKRILGWSNSGVGGVADQMAFFASESASTSFGPVSLRRPGKITYASDTKTQAYMEQGLSDSVSWKAEFAGRGFQDVRQLSQTALLWASFGAEERALLYGRGTSGNGYAGVVAAPVISGSTATTGGSIAAGTYQITVTAMAGGGQSVVSNRVAQVTTGTTSTITVTVGTEPTGALGYFLYVSQAGGGAGTETFQTAFAGNTYTLTTPPTSTGAAIPGADSTASANAYDGYLTVQADPTQSGYVKRVNASIATLGDKPWQDAFLALYGASNEPGGGAFGNKLLADPDEIWVDGTIRNALGQWLKLNASTVSYRLVLNAGDRDGIGGAVIGSVVGGISNQTTGKMVDMEVHPYMPIGNSLIRSRTLPVPDSEISNTSAVVNVQDYMSVDWPVIQMTYDLSTYWFGTLEHYAPAWSGQLIGLLP